MERACQLNPQDGELFYWRGKIYKELRDQDSARRDFDKALDLGYLDAAEEKRHLGWFLVTSHFLPIKNDFLRSHKWKIILL